MKKDTSKISIIIPMYNVERYIRRCLDSVLNQTFSDWQAICVDDGSPDKSGAIAEEYAARDKRFIVVHKKNGGLSDARNVGLTKVKSKYVMFLDSDDCIHPQTMEIVYNIAERECVDIVSFKNIMDVPSSCMPDWFANSYDVQNTLYKLVNNELLIATNRDKGFNSWWVQQCVVWAHLYRFDFIKNIKFQKDIHILEDFAFWSCVLFNHPKAAIIKLPLYSYTTNPESILHTAKEVDTVFNLIKAVKFSYQKLKENKVSWSNSRRWRARFMFDILSRVYNYSKCIYDKDILHEIASQLAELRDCGAFDNPPDFHAWRYKRRILKFIRRN